jgi:putative ABC transport system permease protein
MSSLLYSLRLSLRSLRRDLGFSVVMIVSLALSVSLFVTAMTVYQRSAMELRTFRRFPGVYRIQVLGIPLATFRGAEEFSDFAKYASYLLASPQVRVLRGGGIPTAESPSFMGTLWGGLPGQVNGGPLAVRFCTRDLFELFASPFRYGGPWRRSDGSAPDGVVLNAELNERLFAGRDSVGKTLLIEGRAMTVVGVLAARSGAPAEWDLNPLEERGEVMVDFALADVFRPTPVFAFPPTLPGSWETLASSPSRFIEYWLALPTPELRDRFETRLASVDKGLGLLPLDSGNPAADHIPATSILFLAFAGAVVLASLLNIVRLLLAKGMSRSSEIGVHRALGAPRKVIFFRQLIEGGLVVVGGTVIGVLLGAPLIVVFDFLVPDTPTHLVLDPGTALLSLLSCVLLGLLAGIFPAWRVAAIPPTRYLGRI